jgi:hypothetical protein
MKKVIRLTESDLIRLVKRVINEGNVLDTIDPDKIDKDLSEFANQTGSWKVDENGESISLSNDNGELVISIHGSNYGAKSNDVKNAAAEKTNSFKPEEITNFLKNGGNVEQNGKVITSQDQTKGYKFQQIDPKGNVVLNFSTGEGKLLIINPNSKKYTLFSKSAMTDQWVNDGSGTISFDGGKIVL